jgi:acetyltransferase-like isoleucine patch superfamily enzyme
VHYIKDALTAKNYFIGTHSYSDGEINIIGDTAELHIGKFCSVAKNVTVFLGENHHTEWVTTYPFPIIGDMWTNTEGLSNVAPTKGDVVIGNDVWIGQGVTIMSGVTIGDGSVIGACSVVAKDIPPYSIAVGNPVRVVKYRFDEETIKKLLKLRWWRWSDNQINEHLKEICSEDIEKLCTIHIK